VPVATVRSLWGISDRVGTLRGTLSGLLRKQGPLFMQCWRFQAWPTPAAATGGET
jgi:hypothetical protein